MRCEMCGSEEQLFKTKIEDAEMTVCKSCSEHGEVISKVRTQSKEGNKKQKSKEVKKEVPDRPSVIKMVKDGYSKKIKQKREARGLKQEELAQRLGEKASIIHKLETGHMEPSIELARKLERFLNITLIEEYEEKPEKVESGESKEMTIGDMIQIQ